MDHLWMRIRRRMTVGNGIRAACGAALILALVTDLFDHWTVPGAGRPYGVYRTDFVGDINRATDVGRLAGTLGFGNRSLPLDSWVGRKR